MDDLFTVLGETSICLTTEWPRLCLHTTTITTTKTSNIAKWQNAHCLICLVFDATQSRDNRKLIFFINSERNIHSKGIVSNRQFPIFCCM